MNYEQLETQIVARVDANTPSSVVVAAFPENNAELIKPYEGAHITVLYKGSTFGDGSRGQSLVRSTAQVVQHEVVRFDLIIRSRFLRGHDYSCLRLLKSVRSALVGYMPDDCDRVSMTGSEMVFSQDEQPGDVFTYVCSFETTTLAVENFDEATEQLGVLTDVEFNWP